MPSKRRKYSIITAIALALAIVAAVFAYNWWTSGDASPSGPTLAPTLAAPAAATPARPAAASEETAREPAPGAAATQAPTDELAQAPADDVAAPSASAEAKLYRIEAEGSTVSFAVDEVLNGEPFTAVGTTDDVAGDIIIDFSNPAASQLGTIVINARTIATDSGFRDRAISNQILQSSQDDFEFITFVPTALTGLPAAVAVGDSASFQVVGELTIRDITLPTTWEATVTVDGPHTIAIGAQTIVLRSDYQLTIPSVPRVAGVDDDVLLTIEAVAREVES